MSDDIYETTDLITELRDDIRAVGGQNTWAEQNGVSASYLSDLLNGRRKISAAFARVLGYERQVVFVRKTR